MNREKMVENLKKNERAFVFLNEEERKLIAELNGTGNIQCLNSCVDWESRARFHLALREIFRINPDYTEPVEPHEEKCRVFRDKAGCLYFWRNGIADSIHLHKAVDFDDFDGLQTHHEDDGFIGIRIDSVAKNMNRGRAVYVIFKK